jgi:hypothetical protein
MHYLKSTNYSMHATKFCWKMMKQILPLPPIHQGTPGCSGSAVVLLSDTICRVMFKKYTLHCIGRIYLGGSICENKRGHDSIKSTVLDPSAHKDWTMCSRLG